MTRLFKTSGKFTVVPGVRVPVGVSVGVSVAVPVGESVGVSVAVSVGVFVAVSVGVFGTVTAVTDRRAAFDVAMIADVAVSANDCTRQDVALGPDSGPIADRGGLDQSGRMH